MLFPAYRRYGAVSTAKPVWIFPRGSDPLSSDVAKAFGLVGLTTLSGVMPSAVKAGAFGTDRSIDASRTLSSSVAGLVRVWNFVKVSTIAASGLAGAGAGV